MLTTDAPAAFSIDSNVGSAARIFSPSTDFGPVTGPSFEAKPPGVHHQVTMCTPFRCASACSFSAYGERRSFIAKSRFGIVPGRITAENSCALPVAYDIRSEERRVG